MGRETYGAKYPLGSNKIIILVSGVESLLRYHFFLNEINMLMLEEATLGFMHVAVVLQKIP